MISFLGFPCPTEEVTSEVRPLNNLKGSLALGLVKMQFPPSRRVMIVLKSEICILVPIIKIPEKEAKIRIRGHLL